MRALLHRVQYSYKTFNMEDYEMSQPSMVPLTEQGLNKIAAISQITFWNAIS